MRPAGEITHDASIAVRRFEKLSCGRFRDGKIAGRQEKTDAPLLIPIAAELADALVLMPGPNMTVLRLGAR